MKYTFFGSIALLSIVLSSCESSSSAKKISAYFDVANLFNSQATLVLNTSFQKTASIDGENETKTVRFDSLEWTKELSMFANMDINKAVLVGAFDEEETTTETGRTVTYRKKPELEGGVQWIRLDYDGKGNVAAFSGLFREENALYQNMRELSATFSSREGMPTIEEYSIKGFQKILMKDTVNYEIEAKAVH
jgi:hypothetical protein